MKHSSFITIGLFAVAITLAGCTGRPPALNDDGWITLFDGTEESLNKNWTAVGANWRVYRGTVMADQRTGKDSGYLISKNSYKDFQIRAEFWVSEDANSGIYMRCSDAKNITDKNCYEANIFDKSGRPLWGTGSIVYITTIYPMPKTGGKWNTYDITVRGSRLSVWLNGDMTADALDSKFASGPIALQYGAGVVRFRKVQVKPL